MDGLKREPMTTSNIHELANMVKKDSAASQDHLAESVAELLASQGDSLSDREKALMAGMLRQLLEEAEKTIRQNLAERLSHAPNVPAEVIEFLANDEIDVARPVLLHSEVLSGTSLIEIIRHRTLEHQLAISMRQSVSEQVSDALVETGHERVIIQLLENQNAKISRKTMAYLVEQSRRVDSYQNPIIERRDLPPELAQRMYAWVSESLRTKVLTRFSLDREALDSALAASCDEAILEDHQSSDATGELVEEIIGNQRPEPARVLEFLRDGEIPLFEEAFGRLVGIDRGLVRRLIYEPGGEGLAVACRAESIQKSDFASIFILSRQARPGDQTVQRGEVRRVLELYDRLQPGLAKTIFVAWQRDPQYFVLRNDLKVALANAA